MRNLTSVSTGGPRASVEKKENHRSLLLRFNLGRACDALRFAYVPTCFSLALSRSLYFSYKPYLLSLASRPCGARQVFEHGDRHDRGLCFGRVGAIGLGAPQHAQHGRAQLVG